MRDFDPLSQAPKPEPPPEDPYDPIPVYGVKDGKEHTYGYACAKCNNVFQTLPGDTSERTIERVRNHCKPCPCNRGHLLQGHTECSQCMADARSKHIEAKNEAAFPTLPRIEAYAWDGPVYHEARDRYYESIDDLLEHFDDDDEEKPQWVYPCDVEEFSLDASTILESACDDHCEEMAEEVQDDADSLQKLLDDWCKTIRTKTWRPDTGRIVVLEHALFGEE